MPPSRILTARRVFRTGVALSVVLLAASVPAAGQTPSEIVPGDGRIDGNELSEYVAVWGQSVPQGDEWAERAEISEELVREGDRWIRTQRVRQGPLELIVEVRLDRASLRPLSLHRSLAAGVPEAVIGQLAQAGFVKEIEIEFGETDYVVRATPFSGEASEVRGDMGVPFFDASTLGLVLAATDVGSGVRLPALFVNASNGDVTEYWIEATTADGEETIAGTAAVRIDVGWYDLSGTVVSAPGADAAGGAYWIATGAQPSPAPVLRYKNESADILIRTDR